MATVKSKNPYINVAGRPEWIAWVNLLADFAKEERTDVVEMGLQLYAEKVGFTTPMPKRVVVPPRQRLGIEIPLS